MTISSGETFAVTKNSSGCRVVKLPEFNAAEQNKKKPSAYAAKAKSGAKITWFLGGAPWGRIVDGEVEDYGKSITPSGGEEAAAAPAVKKKPAAAMAADEEPDAEPPEPPPPKKAKTVAEDPAEDVSGPDVLSLAPLFAGKGHGAAWQKILAPVIEGLPNAAAFIGPARDKRMVPVRELTFQALKPTPPSGWRVISFGQSPFPRIESATGIAHFDNALSSWEDKRFASVTTMRCIIKAAAMNRFGSPKGITTAEMRELLKSNECVGPAEWFQAMLAQGVLFMNAACTLLPPEDKATRAGSVVEEHRRFWQPVVEAVIDAILSECSKQGRGIVFAWWGAECLKTKSALSKQCLSRYPDVKVEHIDHKNPAAMGDAFCDPPNVFKQINDALCKLKLGSIDWLPSSGWQGRLANDLQPASGSGLAAQMGDFITETQELHKMYLERLKDGLDSRDEDLPDITGVMASKLVSLAVACKTLALEAPAKASVTQAGKMKKGELSKEEAAAIHMYTTNHLYKKLNEALRSPDRSSIEQFFLYLRLLLTALRKLPATSKPLYRGVALDLRAQYKAGSKVTWWAVSSCTQSLAVANSFSAGASKSTLFVVEAKTGVGIKEFSEYKGEEEFVLAPGTQFKVDRVLQKSSKLTEVHLQELSEPCRVR